MEGGFAAPSLSLSARKRTAQEPAVSAMQLLLGGWGAAHAAVAGLLGALAACSAKLALGADYLLEGCLAALGGEGARVAAAGLCDWFSLMLRAGCGGLMFACNAVMWTFFAKALRYSSSSATATVTSTASNFISSAFLGKLLFGETRALLWWIGISITLCGLLLLHLHEKKKVT